MRYSYVAWRLATALLTSLLARQVARAFHFCTKRILPRPTLSFHTKNRLYSRYQLLNSYA